MQSSDVVSLSGRRRINRAFKSSALQVAVVSSRCVENVEEVVGHLSEFSSSGRWWWCWWAIMLQCGASQSDTGRRCIEYMGLRDEVGTSLTRLTTRHHCAQVMVHAAAGIELSRPAPWRVADVLLILVFSSGTLTIVNFYCAPSALTSESAMPLARWLAESEAASGACDSKGLRGSRPSYPSCMRRSTTRETYSYQRCSNPYSSARAGISGSRETCKLSPLLMFTLSRRLCLHRSIMQPCQSASHSSFSRCALPAASIPPFILFPFFERNSDPDTIQNIETTSHHSSSAPGFDAYSPTPVDFIALPSSNPHQSVVIPVPSLSPIPGDAPSLLSTLPPNAHVFSHGSTHVDTLVPHHSPHYMAPCERTQYDWSQLVALTTAYCKDLHPTPIASSVVSSGGVTILDEAERICKAPEDVETCPGHHWLHRSYHIQVKQWVEQTEESERAWQQQSGEQMKPRRGGPVEESSTLEHEDLELNFDDHQLRFELCSTTEDEANLELEWDTVSYG
jgi:hypothetical protein